MHWEHRCSLENTYKLLQHAWGKGDALLRRAAGGGDARWEMLGSCESPQAPEPRSEGGGARLPRAGTSPGLPGAPPRAALDAALRRAGCLAWAKHEPWLRAPRMQAQGLPLGNSVSYLPAPGVCFLHVPSELCLSVYSESALFTHLVFHRR